MAHYVWREEGAERSVEAAAASVFNLEPGERLCFLCWESSASRIRRGGGGGRRKSSEDRACLTARRYDSVSHPPAQQQAEGQRSRRGWRWGAGVRPSPQADKEVARMGLESRVYKANATGIRFYEGNTQTHPRAHFIALTFRCRGGDGAGSHGHTCFEREADAISRQQDRRPGQQQQQQQQQQQHLMPSSHLAPPPPPTYLTSLLPHLQPHPLPLAVQDSNPQKRAAG
ncbi:unnamed protein product [Pleuronectes platessa]|uniref:Uncharacterized protein n=1 Tax=Pleuronectes platessa TaxID=8262 RepID=A0A9N7VX94_PLEPL|nr:unnamed protein product [Pleuronectes platessa]